MQIAEGVRLVTFAILSLMMLGSALGVVLFANIVYSAFLLGGVFISMAGIYILLNADFVSAAQILVYVGAVNVLILFAIMLVNKREDFTPMKNAWIRQGSTAVVCAGLFALLSAVSIVTPWKISTITPLASTIVPIAKHFFTDFLLPFELASILLLMSMIGAIVLARRDFMPEGIIGTSTQDSLTLPERPRELVGTEK
ncbi:NADH-quinone oxidoreductase subunit J [Chamaesiphon sp. VAR_48_metabat_403]|uniref:NADH-quinone oxidoreductase subunit J n=1 Tax=Chamaesiphon sp. VAR_48_metabat_403 TaxID=2964700 RepID=UPI00286E7F39|nr:NADH-quinone oxidoreductase subunit J [Chamaesiphon sp. VAR_48_metabat_403]